MTGKLSVDTEKRLAEFLAGFYDDPYGFVMAVFPWGSRMQDGIKVRIPGMEKLPDGSPNPLIDKVGPENWQREELIALGEHIRDNRIRRELGLDYEVYRLAVASGHGVGKSAFVAWLIYFFMSTRMDTRGAVTASTQFQLEDKTWPELAKWHNIAINKHWFVWAGTSFSFAAYPEERRKTYRTTAATVSEHNTEAFAGLHNEGRTVFVIFDEASGVMSKIWVVAEGALTDGEGFFFAFGNPTRPDGEFADCFDKHASLYRHRNIDSRSVSHTNKAALESIISKYGVDSDEVKVRIRGMFPEQSYNGFIMPDGVNEAMQREAYGDSGAALIMALDAARDGRDESVITFRQGRDARSIPMQAYKGLKGMKLAEVMMRNADMYRPDAIVVESASSGLTVIDVMRDRGYRVFEVFPGSAADDHERFVNKRMEWWYAMREWIYEEGCLNEDKDLFQQLTTIQYVIGRTDQRMKMEAKEDMKARGLSSPDKADSLALTFAVRIARRDRNLSRTARRAKTSRVQDDPIGMGD